MKVRKWLIWSLILVLLFSLTACGSESAVEADYNSAAAQDVYYRAESGDALTSESAAASEVLPENRKLVRTLHMDAETEDLDTLIAALDAKTTQLGGYVEGREVYNGSTYSQRRYRYASITFRIPAENLRSFTDHVADASNVVSSSETIDDITLQYVDTESRVKALEVEQERLMALLEQAETLSDLLQIEDRLTEVRYELENYESRLRTYDNKVDYATVYLDITEVTEYTPVEEETLWQRISGGFMHNLKAAGEGLLDFFVWLIVNSPFLAIYAAVGALVIWLLRKRKAGSPRKTRRTPPTPPAPPAA